MAEFLLGALRLAHALAAATWVGGTLTFGYAGPVPAAAHAPGALSEKHYG